MQQALSDPSRFASSEASYARAPLAFRATESERARVIRVATDVRRIVARFAEVDPAAIVATYPLDGLRQDPGMIEDVTLALEARFDLDIDGDEATRWQTVGDVVATVATALRARRAASPLDTRRREGRPRR